MIFMSPEHVAAMNEILDGNADVRAACGELERPYVLGYELADGPSGGPVHWSMTFADTVQFGLEKVDADLLFRGDWTQMIRASLATREGQQVDPGVTPVGDLSVMEKIGPAFAVAQGVATLPVEFPEV